jgi:hypothetical protein
MTASRTCTALLLPAVGRALLTALGCALLPTLSVAGDEDSRPETTAIPQNAASASQVAPASTSPAATTGAVSFSRDLVPVLKSSCATCHLTGTEAGNLALHPGAAYKSLVNVQSIESKWLRVKPGAPDESYMLMKLDGTHLDGGGSGGRMPFNMEPLDAGTRQRFRDWIAAGAADN